MLALFIYGQCSTFASLHAGRVGAASGLLILLLRKMQFPQLKRNCDLQDEPLLELRLVESRHQ